MAKAKHSPADEKLRETFAQMNMDPAIQVRRDIQEVTRNLSENGTQKSTF
jgi:hypothetical protein